MRAGLLFAIGVACTLGPAAPAAAVDGVIEINQSRAMAGGVSPADTPGFPVTVSQPGSYRLTGNLTAPVGWNGIVVQARDVTIDLNGFGILGPATGIVANGVRVETGSDNFELRNGTIQSFAGYGVFVSGGVPLLRIIDVRALDNANTGLLIQGDGALVQGCTAARNGGAGIRGFPGSLVLGNVAYDNDGVGLLLNDVAWGSNILYANNGGNANSQVNASLSVQVATNQCGTSSCP